MNNCAECKDPTGCINCEIQIRNSQPLKMAMKIAEASNYFKSPSWALEQIKEENAELTIAVSKALRDLNMIIFENLKEEMSDVLFLILCICKGFNIKIEDLERIMIDKTKKRHPEQWERVLNKS